MIKRTVSLLVLLLICMSIGYSVSAMEEYDELLYASGADGLPNELPQETLSLLEKAGAADISADKLSSLSLEGIAAAIFDASSESAKTPIGCFAQILAVTVICALLEGIRDEGSQLKENAAMAGTLSMALIVLTPLLTFIKRISTVIETAGSFERAFIPVFAGVITAGGKPSAAAGYAGITAAVVEGSSAVICEAVMPLIRILLAITAVSCVCDKLSVRGILEGGGKLLKWILGTTAVVTVAAISVSGLITAQSDSVASKAARFVVSGSVPVVGGALGDAVTSVQSCLGLLRSSIGAFGIIAGGFLMLPVIAEGAAWSIVLKLCAGIGEMLGVSSVPKLLSGVESAVSLLCAVCIFMGFILTVSAAIIISIVRV